MLGYQTIEDYLPYLVSILNCLESGDLTLKKNIGTSVLFWVYHEISSISKLIRNVLAFYPQWPHHPHRKQCTTDSVRRHLLWAYFRADDLCLCMVDAKPWYSQDRTRRIFIAYAIQQSKKKMFSLSSFDDLYLGWIRQQMHWI